MHVSLSAIVTRHVWGACLAWPQSFPGVCAVWTPFDAATEFPAIPPWLQVTELSVTNADAAMLKSDGPVRFVALRHLAAVPMQRISVRVLALLRAPYLHLDLP